MGVKNGKYLLFFGDAGRNESRVLKGLQYYSNMVHKINWTRDLVVGYGWYFA